MTGMKKQLSNLPKKKTIHNNFWLTDGPKPKGIDSARAQIFVKMIECYNSIYTPQIEIKMLPNKYFLARIRKKVHKV